MPPTVGLASTCMAGTTVRAMTGGCIYSFKHALSNDVYSSALFTAYTRTGGGNPLAEHSTVRGFPSRASSRPLILRDFGGPNPVRPSFFEYLISVR